MKIKIKFLLLSLWVFSYFLYLHPLRLALIYIWSHWSTETGHLKVTKKSILINPIIIAQSIFLTYALPLTQLKHFPHSVLTFSKSSHLKNGLHEKEMASWKIFKEMYYSRVFNKVSSGAPSTINMREQNMLLAKVLPNYTAATTKYVSQLFLLIMLGEDLVPPNYTT